MFAGSVSYFTWTFFKELVYDSNVVIEYKMYINMCKYNNL